VPGGEGRVDLIGAGALVLAPLIINSRSEVAQPRALAIIAWLGLAATVLAYSLYSKGLRRTSAITAGTLSMAEPLAAALLSTTLLGNVCQREKCSVVWSSSPVCSSR
jgi:drug/metabolite transporter (DMT)-like permease